jgi:hypothetical protein
MLTVEDERYWAPIKEVHEALLRIIPKGAKVLDVGPGARPFPRADVVIDFQSPEVFEAEWPKEIFKRDLSSELLPFKDKSFDFIFCRHVLEDMWNPFQLMREMSRVGKAGYIECPSPIVELCRGVETGQDNKVVKWRGYHHHHWFVWVKENTLIFTEKYPLIEHMGTNDEVIESILKTGPKYWNTYYLWSGKIGIKHCQNAIDYHIPRGEYGKVLTEAMKNSIKFTDTFFTTLESK